MTISLVAYLTHTVVVVALIAAYVVLAIYGVDGNALLAALAGYLGGAGAQFATMPKA